MQVKPKSTHVLAVGEERRQFQYPRVSMTWNLNLISEGDEEMSRNINSISLTKNMTILALNPKVQMKSNACNINTEK